MSSASIGPRIFRFTTGQRTAFVDLCLAGLLPASPDNPSTGRFSLYDHQLEMLRKGIGTGSPGIVTSGTGSGKTEAFLLPIIASITKEATKWPKSDSAGWQPWWKSDDEAPNFCRDAPYENKARPKAVRALVLYL